MNKWLLTSIFALCPGVAFGQATGIPSLSTSCNQPNASDLLPMSQAGSAPSCKQSLVSIFNRLPGGRISDNTINCAHTTDSAAVTGLYYLPCGGNTLPISPDGVTLTIWSIPSTATFLSTANATNFPVNTLFDYYAFINSGAVTYCGVKWGVSTAGSSSRGVSASITTIQGITVNSGAWTCYNSGTSYTLASGEATLLGTFYIAATAQFVPVQFAPTAATTGSSCTVGYANIYNTQSATCLSRDSSGNWTFTSTTIGQLAGSTGNQANWVDPLGGSAYVAALAIVGKTATAGDNMQAGIGINVTNAFTGPAIAFLSSVQPVNGSTTVLGAAPQSGGGLNYVAALQQGYNGTIVGTLYGVETTNTPQVEGLSLSVPY